MGKELTESLLESFTQRPATAILMSGYGSNAEAILSDEEIRDLYDIRAIITDNSQSRAVALAENYGVDATVAEVKRFVSSEQRQTYFDSISESLRALGASSLIYAGFMKITPANFCQEFPGVNVHPADLTIMGVDGLPKYRGMSALSEMRLDLGYVRSTVHVVDAPVDSGSAISTSDPEYGNKDETDEELHEKLKVKEHSLYPMTLKIMGRGLVNIQNIPLSSDLVGAMI